MSFCGKPEVAIGIDLGTSNSRVSLWHGGRIEVLENEDILVAGSMPSYVAFTEFRRLMGTHAKAYTQVNSSNTIYNVLRLVTNSFDNQSLQEMRERLPFTVVNVDGKPEIELSPKLRFKPIEIIAMILSKLKIQAEEHVGDETPIQHAVIIVPAGFTSLQRQMISDAAAIAGLTVMRFLSGSTAAILYACGRQQTSVHPPRRLVLAYDLGGGSLDITLAEVHNGVVEVKATDGNLNIGGQDIDECMVDHLVKDIAERSNLDITHDRHAMSKLRHACERAKELLSTRSMARVEIDGLTENSMFYSREITRMEFIGWCEPLIRSSITSIENVMIKSDVDKEDVHDYILVGGLAQMPLVVASLARYFGKTPLTVTDSRGVAVDSTKLAVLGAGLQSMFLCERRPDNIEDFVLNDVISIPIGVKGADGAMRTLVKRNAAYPTEVRRTYSTGKGYYNHVIIRLYEGGRAETKDNAYMGEFEVLCPWNETTFDIVLNVDELGLVRVDRKQTRVREGFLESWRMSREELDISASKIIVYDDQDAEEAMRTIREDAMRYLNDLMRTLQDLLSVSTRAHSDIQQWNHPVKKRMDIVTRKLQIQSEMKRILARFP